MIFHVVAAAQNGVIGKNNKLPWHFSSDLRNFKALTTGHTVIMGRKTFESIGCKALPKRKNLVVSRSGFDVSSSIGEVAVYKSIEQALSHVETENAYIIGGMSIYEQTMDAVNGIYLTLIHQDYEGDAFYPSIPDFFKVKNRTILQAEPLLEVVYYENSKLTDPLH